MGCWNKTCGITGLPITDTEEVLIVPLLQNSDPWDRTYTTAFWKPLMPYYGFYNDYGSSNNSSGIGLDFLLNFLDQEIGGESFSEEKFYATDCVVKNRWPEGQDQQVDFVMIKKSVIDKLELDYHLNHHFTNKLVFENEDNDIAEIVLTISSLVKDGKLLWSIDNIKRTLQENVLVFNLIDYCEFFNYLCDLVKTDKLDEAKEFLKAWALLSRINRFLDAVRKNWAPAGHEGSQEGINPAYATLTNIIQDELFKEYILED